MTQPRVLMCSMWREDMSRALVDRVEHLLAKCEAYPNMAYLWLVGDSTDDTAQALRDLSVGYENVTVLDIGNTGITGDDMDSRLRRLSVTANHYFWHAVGFDYVLVCESDLSTPYDLVGRMVAHAESGHCPVAGWPILKLGGRTLFYDVFCYRKDGVRFGSQPPHHACCKDDGLFTVDSFGSCFMFAAEDAPLLHMDKRAVLDLCDQLRQQGRTLWVDRLLIVEQPKSLWQFHAIIEGV